MSVTAIKDPTAFETALEAAFRSRSNVNETQAAAFDAFAGRGFPNRRVEGWKWSDFSAALRSAPTAHEAGSSDVAPSPFAALNPIEIRILDGRIECTDETPPEGLRFGVMDPVGTIVELEKHPIALLNVGMVRKSLGLEVEEGVTLERPIHVRHLQDGPAFVLSQTMMRFSRGARATLIETYEGKAGFYSHLFHTAIRDGAEVERYVLQNGGADAVTHAIIAAKVDEGARLRQLSLATGGKLARQEAHVHFWGAGASVQLDSASLLSGEAHADFTSDVRFFAEECTARQVHKGVATDRGRNVFQGKFFVKRDAQKTDAQMTANALLLSETAEANHKPELEIYADDVECAHGSTAGALDDDALFYLRQRGLDEHQARALLIEAFVGEVIDTVENEEIAAVFRAKTNEWLEGQA